MNFCLFCSLDGDDIVIANDHAYVLFDNFPVTRDHALIIPREHVESYFDLDTEQLAACDELLCEMRIQIMENDPSVTGFNLGINDGAVAGQTIKHCHIHLIPRREGDVAEPMGGVRNVIPGKGSY